jgi:hypothetical protein
MSELFSIGKILCNHFFAHLLGGNLWYPSEFLFGFAGIAEQGLDFGGAEVARVNVNHGFFIPIGHFVDALTFPAQRHAQGFCCPVNELAHAVLQTGGDNKVIRLFLLQHHPLHAHIVFGVAPVAKGVDITHVQAVFQALADVGQAAGILRVTKVSPRRGLSWLNKMPLQAYMP